MSAVRRPAKAAGERPGTPDVESWWPPRLLYPLRAAEGVTLVGAMGATSWVMAHARPRVLPDAPGRWREAGCLVDGPPDRPGIGHAGRVPGPAGPRLLAAVSGGGAGRRRRGGTRPAAPARPQFRRIPHRVPALDDLAGRGAGRGIPAAGGVCGGDLPGCTVAPRGRHRPRPGRDALRPDGPADGLPARRRAGGQAPGDHRHHREDRPPLPPALPDDCLRSGSSSAPSPPRPCSGPGISACTSPRAWPAGSWRPGSRSRRCTRWGPSTPSGETASDGGTSVRDGAWAGRPEGLRPRGSGSACQFRLLGRTFTPGPQRSYGRTSNSVGLPGHLPARSAPRASWTIRRAITEGRHD